MKQDLRTNKRRGFTLIEVSVSLLLVATIVLALMNVRYFAHKHAVRADVYTTASRLSLLLLESWRSTTTPADYNPVTDFDVTGETVISTSGTGPPVPGGFTQLGSYHMVLEGSHYYATLAYINETSDDPAKLYVCIGWKNRYTAGDVSTDGEYYTLASYE
jgi:prepilin-type N-terminal cleavage/methylation domain-containing protein